MVEYETITDSISLSDTVDSSKIQTVTITDTLTMTDTGSTAATITVTDAITAGESLAPYRRVFRHGRIIYNFPTTINGNPVKLKRFRITRNLSRVSKLTADAPKTEITGVSLGDDLTVRWQNEDGDSFTIFEGIITAVDTPERSPTASIKADGIEIKLAKDVYAVIDTDAGTVNGVFEYTNERADVIAADILDGTDFSLIECPTDTITLKFDYTNRWKALGLIADILDVDLWVDNSNGVHLGLKHGVIDVYDAIYKRVTSTDITQKVNRVIIIGGVNGSGSIPVGVAQDGTDINDNFPMVEVRKFSQIQDVDTATKLARVYLDRFNRETIELRLELAINSRNIRLREGDNITVDGEDYKITKLTISPDKITVIATPSVAVPDLTSYLKDKAQSGEQTNISSDFESSTPVAFTIYENIELAPDPDGDGTDETITIDGTDYTVLGVMHFYTPENFTAESVTVYIRQFSATIGSFGVVCNNTLLTLEETTADDGKKEYKAVIPAEIIVSGWNFLYFINTGA